MLQNFSVVINFIYYTSGKIIHGKMRKEILLSVLIILLLLLPLATIVFTPSSAEEIPIGGTLRTSVSYMVQSLTVGQEMPWTDFGCLLVALVYDQLDWVGPYPDFGMVPRLAYDWEVSPDGKVWTFYLVKNATWHDGKPVTAEDVVFTAKYLPRLSWWNASVADVVKAEILDNYTVRLTFRNVVPEFPMWWHPILPKHIWWPYRYNLTYYPNPDCIGSGPFMVEDFEPGEYMVLKRYENYHGTGRRVYIDRVVFQVYGSTEAEVIALKKGEIDFISGLIPSAALELNGTKDIVIDIAPGDSISWFTFNFKTPDERIRKIVNDVHFRKAVAYAIDKQEIIDIVFLGYGTPADTLIYSEFPGHNPNLPQYEYNPKKAEEILDKYGYVDKDGDGIREAPDGTPLKFKLGVAESWTWTLKQMQVVAQQLERVGIKVEIVAIDEGTWWGYAFSPEESPFHMLAYTELPSPEYSWIYYEFLSIEKGGGSNFWGYSNSTYDETFWEYMNTADPDKRRELEWKMQEILAEDVAAVFLVRPKVFSAYRTDKFEGWRSGMGGLWAWYDDWLFYSVHLKPGVVEEQPRPTKPTNYYWWIIGGAVAAVAATIVFLLVKKRFIKP